MAVKRVNRERAAQALMTLNVLRLALAANSGDRSAVAAANHAEQELATAAGSKSESQKRALRLLAQKAKR